MKEQELDEDIARAKYELGDDYKEEARQGMILKHQFVEDQMHNFTTDQAESGNDTLIEEADLAQIQVPEEKMDPIKLEVATENLGDVAVSSGKKAIENSGSLQVELRNVSIK